MIDWGVIAQSLFIGAPATGLGLLAYRNTKRGDKRSDFDSITREWKALAEQAKKDLADATKARQASEDREQATAIVHRATLTDLADAREQAAECRERCDALETRVGQLEQALADAHLPIPPA